MHARSEEGNTLQPGIDLLLTRQVADREGVNPVTVLRWIEKGLPAMEASPEQLAELVRLKYLENIPPHKVFLVRETDLTLIPQIRAYPKHTHRHRRDKR